MIEAAKRKQTRAGWNGDRSDRGKYRLGLALVAAAKGYRIVLVIPDKMSQEKIAHVRGWARKCD